MCLTIQEALDSFNQDNERKMLSPDTLRYYAENLTRFYKWLSDNRITKIKHLNSKVLSDYTLSLARTIKNKTTVNTYLRSVRRFVNYLISQNEIKPFKVRMLKDTYKIKPTFNNKEVNLILSSIDPENDTSIMMLLLLSTGMRSRSLCELRVQDINFADKYIDLHITKNGVPLCPPIGDKVLKCLNDYLKKHALLPSDRLFKNRYNQPFNKHSMRKRLSKGLHKIGINKSGVHIFRHTFGKIMSMNGCPTAILQKWLGHSDIKITQKYTDLYCDDLRKSIDQVPSAIFKYEK